MPGPIKKPTGQRVGRVNRSTLAEKIQKTKRSRKPMTGGKKLTNKRREAIKIKKWAESPEGKKYLDTLKIEADAKVNTLNKAYPQTPEEWTKFLKDYRTPCGPKPGTKWWKRLYGKNLKK